MGENRSNSNNNEICSSTHGWHSMSAYEKIDMFETVYF